MEEKDESTNFVDDGNRDRDRDEMQTKKGGEEKEVGDESSWKMAIDRLYSTIVSISNTAENTAAIGGPGSSDPMMETLNTLLVEVEENEDITEKELLERVQARPTAADVVIAATATDDTSGDGITEVTPPPPEISVSAKGGEECGEKPAAAAEVTTSKSSSSLFPGEEDLQKQKQRSFGSYSSGGGEQQPHHRELFKRLSRVGEVLSSDGAAGGVVEEIEELDDILFRNVGTSKYQSAVEYLTGKLQDQWDQVLNVLLPRQQLQTLLLVSLVQVVSVERVFALVPFAVCYAAYLLMMYSTMAMFGSRKWLRRAENWKRLLSIFRRGGRAAGGRGAEADVISVTAGIAGSGSLYSWKTSEPYVTYFISLAVFTFSLALTGGSGELGGAESVGTGSGSIGGTAITTTVTRLPNSWSMCAVSAFFAVLCFVALADRNDKLSLLVMALDLVSATPAICAKFRPGTTTTAGLLAAVCNNWQLGNIGLIKLHIGIPSLAFLSILSIYVYMIVRRKPIGGGHGDPLFSLVVPHFVCAAWWHTSLELFLVSDPSAVFASSSSSSIWMIGAFYEIALTIGVIWLITYPTMAAFVLILAIVTAQLKNLVDAVGLAKTTLTTGTILIIPLLYWRFREWAEKRRWFTISGSSDGRRVRFKTTLLALLIYAFLVFTAGALLYEPKFADRSIDRSAKKAGGGGLSWTHFERHCAYGDENLGNRLRQQIACSQLAGVRAVDWRGTIQGVRIVKIDNIFETLLGYLPAELASRLRCFYGERIADRQQREREEKTAAGRANRSAPTIDIGVGGGGIDFSVVIDSAAADDDDRDDACTLVDRNVYTFEMDVSGPWGQHTFSSTKGMVVLVASPNFQELAMQFEQGDVVDFTASFVPESLLKYPPKLKLRQLQCFSCQHVSGEMHRKLFVASAGGAVWTKLFDACCFLFNFVFSPLFVID